MLYVASLEKLVFFPPEIYKAMEEFTAA